MNCNIIGDYNLRKKHHYCVRCGKQDAYTLNGRAKCFECNEKQNKWFEEHRGKYSERVNKYHAQRRADRKAQGICRECGKPAKEGRLKCVTCLAKDAKRHRDKRPFIDRREQMANGICYICLKNKQVEGKKVCAECDAKLAKNREKINWSSHPLRDIISTECEIHKARTRNENGTNINQA